MRMIFSLLTAFALQLLFPFVHAQKTAYTKDFLKYADGEGIRVVGSLNDTLHVLHMNNKNEIIIHLFSSGLDVIGTKKITTATGWNKYISWVVFNDTYYVLLGSNEKEVWQIFKVDASGNFWDKTAEMQKAIANSGFLMTAGVNMEKVNNDLHLILNAYSAKEKKLYWSLTNTDKAFGGANNHIIELDFDDKEHTINKFLIADSKTVYVVRSYNYGSAKFGEFELVRFDLPSGKSKLISFSSIDKNFLNPELKYSEADSSLLLWSGLVLKGTEQQKQNKKQFYYVRMNRALEELGQPGMITMKIKGKETNVVLIGNTSPEVFSNATRRPSMNFYAVQTNDPFVEPAYFSHPKEMIGERIQNVTQSYKLPHERVQNGHVNAVRLNMRLIWLDENGGLINDALLKKQNRKLFPQYYNHFVFHAADSNVYLFYPLNLGGYRQSINYVKFAPTSVSDEQFINANAAYDYMIHAAKQTDGNSFVVPYTYKNTWGILKIAF